jgi:hypothetical protein
MNHSKRVRDRIEEFVPDREQQDSRGDTHGDAMRLEWQAAAEQALRTQRQDR